MLHDRIKKKVPIQFGISQIQVHLTNIQNQFFPKKKGKKIM